MNPGGETGTEESTPRYRPDIDGLRAVAVTSVVFYHVGIWPFSSGYAGVDIFFVISGFLIGGILYRDISSGRFTFANFYSRRARRILPALFAVIAFTCAVCFLIMTPNELSRFGSSSISALLAVSNIHYFLSVNYFSPDSHLDPLLMTWSLGVEEQFYLLFPFLMLWMAPRGKNVAIMTLAALTATSFIAGVYLSTAHPVAAFYLLPSRAWELGAGAIAAIGSVRWRASFPRKSLHLLGAVGMVVTFASIIIFNNDTAFPGVAALVPVSGALLLILAEDSVTNRWILANRPMVYVGRLSYSWYLWHWPLLTIVRICGANEAGPNILFPVALLSFVMAACSLRWIETPFRHSRLTARPLLVRYGALLSALLMIPTAFVLTGGMRRVAPAPVVQMERDIAASGGTDCLLDGTRNRAIPPKCVALRSGIETVALLGDSHAAALAPAVRELAKREGRATTIFTMASCRPLLGVGDWRHDRPQLTDECENFKRDAFSRILSDPGIRTVVLAGFWPTFTYRPDYEKFVPIAPTEIPQSDQDGLVLLGLANAVDTIRKSGRQVVVMGDVPHWRFEPPAAYLDRILAIRAAIGRISGTLAPPSPVQLRLMPGQTEALNKRIFLLFRNKPMVSYVDAFGNLCSGGGCRYEGTEGLYFFDHSHLTKSGARIAIRGLVL